MPCVRHTPVVHWTLRLQCKVGRAMSCQQANRKNGHGDRVPIQQTHIAVDSEVGEKRHRKIRLSIKGNAANEIARRGAKKESQEKVRKDKDKIPKSLPEAIVNVTANFDGYTSQNETPQNQNQRQVVTGEGGSH